MSACENLCHPFTTVKSADFAGWAGPDGGKQKKITPPLGCGGVGGGCSGFEASAQKAASRNEPGRDLIAAIAMPAVPAATAALGACFLAAGDLNHLGMGDHPGASDRFLVR
jgi:hypothetical protein